MLRRISRLLCLSSGSQTDARLPAPRLSSPLPHTVIIQGEVIPLKCSPPGGCRAESFFFLCKNQSGLPIEYKYLSKNTFGFWTADLNSVPIKIMCACKFWETSVGGSSSLQSNQLVFSVIGKSQMADPSRVSESQKAPQGNVW